MNATVKAAVGENLTLPTHISLRRYKVYLLTDCCSWECFTIWFRSPVGQMFHLIFWLIWLYISRAQMRFSRDTTKFSPQEWWLLRKPASEKNKQTNKNETFHFLTEMKNVIQWSMLGRVSVCGRNIATFSGTMNSLLHGGSRYWALFIHTTLNYFGFISRSQQCQILSTEIFTFFSD